MSKEIILDVHGDLADGMLVAIESRIQVPFTIVRVYFIFGTPEGSARGFHAHRKLHQALFCIKGSVEIFCENKDGSKEIHILDSPSKGLIIEEMVWHTMQNFSYDCVLLVLADDFYNEDDYIRQYDDFIRLCARKDLLDEYTCT